MSEDIPETRDDVKRRLDQVKFFGAHSADIGVRTMHRQHWALPARSSAMSRACAIRRARRPSPDPTSSMERLPGGIPEITSRSMLSKYALRFSAMRANTGADAIVRGDRV